MRSSRVKRLWLAPTALVMFAVVGAGLRGPTKETPAETGSYPAPRWPSYLKKPNSVDELLPHARDLVRNKAGFGGNSPGLGLGLL